MAVMDATSVTAHPRRRASPTWYSRSGLGVAHPVRSSSSDNDTTESSPGSAFNPSRPVSSDRRAFWSASGKVRPIAIASPTDCIEVPRIGSTDGNLAKSNLGIFTTT